MKTGPIKKLQEITRRNYLQNKELEWANVYHDSIRGKEWLEKLPLNVGRWAGSYALFYILNRILNDYRPESVVEMGLGESSKFISAYASNELTDTAHVIIEQSPEWRDAFNGRFKLSANSEIKIMELTEKEVHGFASNCYAGIESLSNDKFELYLIDGPFGSPRYSRYDMVRIADNLTPDDEFIIIIDDYERDGEKESATDLEASLKKKGIQISRGVYEGNATVLVLATEKFKYATTL